MTDVAKGVRITNPAPIAAPDVPSPPELIKHAPFIEALAPLLALVGTDAMSIFAEPFEVTTDHISYVSVTPLPDVEPIQVGDDHEFAEWGWPVTVNVDVPR